MDCTISEFLEQVLMIRDVTERLMKLEEYIKRLEDEMKKILAFKNELPLSMVILDDAIGAVREEAKKCRSLNTERVLEQFIPLKQICEEEDDKKVEIFKESEKMSWMSSVRLWNGNSKSNKKGTELDTRKRIDDELSTMKSCDSRSTSIVYGPFEGYNSFPFEVIRKEDSHLVPELSLQTPGIKNPRDDILSDLSFHARVSSRTVSSSITSGKSSVRSGSPSQQQSSRKERRCWSTELHRQFVKTLEQLGGSQVATPKQIRDIMQVDCLTNDEVKSHLQKYRLHIRKDPAIKASAQDHSRAIRRLWSSQTIKQSDSQSVSPTGPSQSDGNSRATSMSADQSMEDEHAEKSDSGSWKSHHAHSSESESV